VYSVRSGEAPTPTLTLPLPLTPNPNPNPNPDLRLELGLELGLGFGHLANFFFATPSVLRARRCYAETAVLLQISRCDLAKFRNVHFESFSLRCSSREGLVYQPPTSRRGGRGCPAQRSAARALERRARPPGVRPLSPVCATPLVGQFGGRRTNPEARLLERRRHPSS